MKFAKALTRDAVPEWRSRYLDYRRLKKILSRVAAERAAEAYGVAPRLNGDSEVGTDANSPSMASSVRRQSRSVDGVPPHVVIANDHQALSALHVSSLPLPLPLPLPSLSPSPSPSPSLRLPIQPSAVGVSTLALSPQSFPQTASRRNTLLAAFSSYTRNRANSTLPEPLVSIELFLTTRKSSEREFFNLLDEEIHKIESFYNEFLAKYTETHTRLEYQASRMKSKTNHKKKSKSKLKLPFVFNNLISSSTSQNTLMEAKTFRAAMLEFYRGLTLLRNYQVLNYTGIVKILKKFDKTAGWMSSNSYLSSRESQLKWRNEEQIMKIMKQVEVLFANTFTSGKRGFAMKQLRLPDNSRQNYLFESTFSGICLGAGMMLFIFTCLNMHSKFSNEQFVPLLQIYGGLVMPIIFSMLFSFNLAIWDQNAINYVFVFEFDPRDHIHPTQFFTMSAFFFVLWSLFFHLSFLPDETYRGGMPPQFLPALFFVTTLLMFLNPLPIFYRNARKWFLRTLWSILTSPIHKIQFRDFFVTDIFTSMIFSLSSLPLFTCVSIRGKSSCDTSNSLSTLSFALIPHSTRLVQCFRRYYDIGTVHPHLWNALKYSLSIAVIVSSFLSRALATTESRCAWISFAVISSSYNVYWDLKEDWGLLRREHKFLRAEQSFSPPLIYYVSILFNILMRSCWALQVSPGSWLPQWYWFLVTILCALIETIRRALWCLFRMENEHLTNCGNFRAVKDIPIPRADEFDENIEDQSSYRKKNSKGAGASIPDSASSSNKSDSEVSDDDDNDNDENDDDDDGVINKRINFLSADEIGLIGNDDEAVMNHRYSTGGGGGGRHRDSETASSSGSLNNILLSPLNMSSSNSGIRLENLRHHNTHGKKKNHHAAEIERNIRFSNPRQDKSIPPVALSAKLGSLKLRAGTESSAVQGGRLSLSPSPTQSAEQQPTRPLISSATVSFKQPAELYHMGSSLNYSDEDINKNSSFSRDTKTGNRTSDHMYSSPGAELSKDQSK